MEQIISYQGEYNLNVYHNYTEVLEEIRRQMAFKASLEDDSNDKRYLSESAEVFALMAKVLTPVILFMIAMMLSCCSYKIFQTIRNWHLAQKRKYTVFFVIIFEFKIY